MGGEGWLNQTKTNDEIFTEYYDLISNTHAPKSLYEAQRLLEHFRSFIGEKPPSIGLAVHFLSRFKNRKQNTKARYTHVISAFFRWYSVENLPIKIKVPKILPQYVPNEDIERLLDAIKNKKSHKKSIERDLLLIETARMTGLRRGELANLKVGDLHLNENEPVLIVRGDKGGKDRAINLNPYIRDQLAAFVKDKSNDERVFDLAAKTISLKIHKWAQAAGVPHLHTHSLRHYVGTTLFQRKANPRAVQSILGHESLDTTMRYASVIGDDTKQTMELLEPQSDILSDYDETAGIMPLVIGKPKDQPLSKQANT